MQIFCNALSLHLISRKMPTLIFDTQRALSAHLKKTVAPSASVGFVPTMGALHDGHLSLIQKSIEDNSATVISIFVNPTQFNNAADLARYPRDIKTDIKKIETLDADVIVYAPTPQDVYGDHIASEKFEFDGLENQMEGKFRPGHFDGVGTVVKKLFEIVKPTHAYLGEKDFQQLQIIRKLVDRNSIPVQIVGCPIYREENGLAMSSRNEQLSVRMRDKASIIHKTLLRAKVIFRESGLDKTHEFVVETLGDNPDFELEYFEIADEKNLEPTSKISDGTQPRAFIAVFANNVRLIDTISLK